MNFFIFCNYICAKNKKENDIYQIPFINSFIKFIELYFHSSFNVGYLVGVAVPTSLLTSRVCGCNILPPQITYFYCTLIIAFLFTFVKIFVNNSTISVKYFSYFSKISGCRCSICSLCLSVNTTSSVIIFL